MLTLVTGGARSGKSSFAQSLFQHTERVVYIATARAEDDEMRERIAKHQGSRPQSWLTIEEPLALPEIVEAHARNTDLVLIDCLTIWLSNFLFEWRSERPATVEHEVRKQAARLIAASKYGNLIAVTNEVGAGIVPESSVARQFRDLQGLLNQQVAGAADFVYLLVAGIPLRIKPAPAVPQ